MRYIPVPEFEGRFETFSPRLELSMNPQMVGAVIAATLTVASTPASAGEYNEVTVNTSDFDNVADWEGINLQTTTASDVDAADVTTAEQITGNPDITALVEAVTIQHTVTPGESLSAVAKLYGVDINSLTEQVENPELIFPVQIISVAIPGAYVRTSNGQSLEEISGQTGLPVNALLQANPGSETLLPENVIVPKASSIIAITQGDTLFRLAANSGISVEELANLNGIANPSHITAGAMIAVPVAANLNITPKNVTVAIPEGITLSEIAEVLLSLPEPITAETTIVELTEEIQQASGIEDPTSIAVGTEIVIPGATAEQAALVTEQLTVQGQSLYSNDEEEAAAAPLPAPVAEEVAADVAPVVNTEHYPVYGIEQFSETYRDILTKIPSPEESVSLYDAHITGEWGPRLPIEDIVRLGVNAGFSGEDLVLWVAVVGSESMYSPFVTRTNNNESTDYGIAQINDNAGGDAEFQTIRNPQANLDPQIAAHNARILFEQRDNSFEAWVGFISDGYLDHMDGARAAVDAVLVTPEVVEPTVPNVAELQRASEFDPSNIVSYSLDHPLINSENYKYVEGMIVDGVQQMVMVVEVDERYVNAEIALQVAKMLEHARNDGINLKIGNSFRTMQEQIDLRLYNGCPDVYEADADECDVPTARPGRSRHQSGLAIDFRVEEESGAICFPKSTLECLETGHPAAEWLVANAPTYGLLNLPSEAWHYSVDGK